MIVTSLVLCLLIYAPLYAKVYNGNFSDFSKCRVHYSRSEKVYKNFYSIPDSYRSSELILDFHFSVLARSDAHILLAPATALTRDSEVYEIVLGAGGNSFSDIRRMQKSDVRATSKEKGILSAIDIKSFWIHIRKDGLLEIGREGEELAFLSWEDTTPLEVKYFSFCTWVGVEAKWFFDCPLATNDTIEEATEIEPELTELERLRKDLLTEYNPYESPAYQFDYPLTVHFEFVSFIAHLDEKRSIFEVEGEATLEWIDEKLTWMPSNYDDQNSLHFYVDEIWKPDFLLSNAVDMNSDILKPSMAVVKSSGIVNWRTKYHFETWCNLVNGTHWPADEHICSVDVLFRKEKRSLKFNFRSKSLVGIQEYSSAWNILDVGTQQYMPDYSEDINEPAIKFYFKLKRHSNMFTAVFFTPFLVIATSLLASFLVSPEGPLKIGLGCLQLILTTASLLVLSYYMPSFSDNIPYLVHLYSYSYFAIVISVAISILEINIFRNKCSTPVPHIIRKMVSSYIIQKIFLLSTTKPGNEYGKIYAGSTKQSSKDCWLLLGIIIDRICFVVYFILICIAIFSRY